MVARRVLGAPLAVVVATVVAGCGGTASVTRTVTRTVTLGAKTGVGPPRDQVLYGHVKSLRRAGGRWLLRFDPAWLLSGRTANAAAVEDGVLRPGEAVPNDHYIVDEGHRLLTYVVSPAAHVTVLTTDITPTRITVPQLAQVVATGRLRGKPLWESLQTGVWITARIDTIRSLDQQYRP